MLLATQQAATTNTPSKKQSHHSKKQEAAAESSSNSLETENSFEDSSDSSDTSTSYDPPPTKPLTSEWAEAMMAGATALVMYPSQEALIQHPAGMLTLCPKVLGHWEAPSGPDPKTLQLASSLVTMDILEDMPKLEEHPPPPFPAHAMSTFQLLSGTRSKRSTEFCYFQVKPCTPYCLLSCTELSFILLIIFLFLSKGVLSGA